MTEQKVKHSRTILVGDLNMNPFEDGVVSALGLHSVMTRKIAAKEKRIVQKSEYPYFYNPMWGLWGDGTDGPAGTYYESRAEHVCHFWNMFDQVLVRPSLFSAFSNKDLKILMHDGTDPLINKHELPDEKHASDHFPILFKLNL